MQKNSIIILIIFSLLSLWIIYAIPGEQEFKEGMNAFDKKDYETAIEKFNAAVTEDSQNHSYVLALATAYYFIEDYKSAVNRFQDYLKLKPRDEKAVFYLADSYNKIADYNNAIQYYKQIPENSPYRKDSQINLAYTYLNSGTGQHIRMGKALFAELTEKYPTEPEIFYGYGKILFNEKLYQDAAIQLNKAKELYGMNPDIYYKLGEIYSILNQKDLASENYQFFLALSTDENLKKEVEEKIKKLSE